jgi:hypothetical protein
MNDNILPLKEDLISVIKNMDGSLVPSVGVSVDGLSTVSGGAVSSVSTSSVNLVSSADMVSGVAVGVASELSDDVNMDEYMDRFEKIQSQVEIVKNAVDLVRKIQPSAGRLESMLIDCIIGLQQQNEEMYNLLVDMNNLFGK